MDLQQLRALPQTSQVVVKFREGEKVRLDGQRLSGMRSGQTSLLTNALSQAGVSEAAMKPLHEAPPAELERDKETAQRRSGRQLADLSLYFVIDLPPGASAAELANTLNALSFVEFARPALRPAPPPVYVIPQAAEPLPDGDAARRQGASPNFASLQAYKGKAPRGIGPLPRMPGADGTGMTFVDIEYDWALAHEDLGLPSDRDIETLTPDPFGGPDHGTAVLGILSVLSPGDVIVIEQQHWVCDTGEYGPLEYYQDVFDAVSVATAKGIIVVAAAGNGNVNLDSPACLGAFDRRRRDSQAIIVGAGSSGDRSRLDFSSYGSRVDVQGWGENVATTGYGDMFNPDNDVRRYYTKSFNGTSSATPIVAGAVLVIQGVRKACGLPPATPLEMRDLLVRSGLNQGEPSTTHIGPLPNIAAALRASVPANCLSRQDQMQPVSDADAVRP